MSYSIRKFARQFYGVINPIRFYCYLPFNLSDYGRHIYGKRKPFDYESIGTLSENSNNIYCSRTLKNPYGRFNYNILRGSRKNILYINATKYDSLKYNNSIPNI